MVDAHASGLGSGSSCSSTPTPPPLTTLREDVQRVLGKLREQRADYTTIGNLSYAEKWRGGGTGFDAQWAIDALRDALSKKQPAADESGWLIEHPNSPAWYGKTCQVYGGWVPASNAIRFARKEDAEAMRDVLARGGMFPSADPNKYKVTEHGFYGPAKKPVVAWENPFKKDTIEFVPPGAEVELSWIISNGDRRTPCYWNGSTWSVIADDAVRFAREKDAQRMTHVGVLAGVSGLQVMWILRAKEGGKTVTEAEWKARAVSAEQRAVNAEKDRDYWKARAESFEATIRDQDRAYLQNWERVQPYLDADTRSMTWPDAIIRLAEREKELAERNKNQAKNIEHHRAQADQSRRLAESQPEMALKAEQEVVDLREKNGRQTKMILQWQDREKELLRKIQTLHETIDRASIPLELVLPQHFLTIAYVPGEWSSKADEWFVYHRRFRDGKPTAYVSMSWRHGPGVREPEHYNSRCVAPDTCANKDGFKNAKPAPNPTNPEREKQIEAWLHEATSASIDDRDDQFEPNKSMVGTPYELFAVRRDEIQRAGEMLREAK